MFAFTCYSHRYTQVLLTSEDLREIVSQTIDIRISMHRHGAALPRTGSVGVIKISKMGKMATVKIAVMHGLLQRIARMLSSLDARKTLMLFVFGTPVRYPGTKAVVPQRTVVALNPLPCLQMLAPSSLANRLQISWRWRRDVCCCWVGGRCSYGTGFCSDACQPQPITWIG